MLLDLKDVGVSRVIWITGLSGAGKSTLAHQVVARLRAEGEAVVMLDGDELREVFGAVAANADNHGREGRLVLAMQYAHLCRVIAAQGLTVVIATISLFREVHAWNRAHLPGYFEVYLHVEPKILRMRDPKGLYKKIDDGLEKNMPGVDITPELPKNPDLFLDNNLHAPKPIEQANKIIAAWEGRAGVKL